MLTKKVQPWNFTPLEAWNITVKAFRSTCPDNLTFGQYQKYTDYYATPATQVQCYAFNVLTASGLLYPFEVAQGK